MRSPEPNPMPVLCPRCDANVIGTPAGYVVFDVPREGLAERVTLLRCPENHPIAVVQEDLLGDNSWDVDPPHRVYPSPDRALPLVIPAELREAHEEARKTFRAKSYVGTVVMSGRTLEAACAVHGVKEASLQKSLRKMKDLGYIDERLWEWAELLREVRNAGAHYDAAAKVSRQDAEDCLTFNEALLDYLYVLKERFDMMRARRAPGAP